jgi:hypothetical protein
MDRYTLSNEGRARFKRTKISMNMEGKGLVAGYEVLDYLFEHGAATIEEIERHTGLPYEQVVNRLGDFISWGYIEELVE